MGNKILPSLPPDRFSSFNLGIYWTDLPHILANDSANAQSGYTGRKSSKTVSGSDLQVLPPLFWEGRTIASHELRLFEDVARFARLPSTSWGLRPLDPWLGAPRAEINPGPPAELGGIPYPPDPPVVGGQAPPSKMT
ncbi:unnamed protein product [Bemisia tabaci]|uniref:Uncharacterized protein n=1 Tax=Bemisia tabaci TaxID=7038 RepID=A0AAI8UV10_BEMTA|nr:unnamed protein product [Bemisia tabaci]